MQNVENAFESKETNKTINSANMQMDVSKDMNYQSNNYSGHTLKKEKSSQTTLNMVRKYQEKTTKRKKDSKQQSHPPKFK